MTRWPYPRIVAHRGGGTLAPENTLAAIRLGAQMGFKGVEIDVMLAGDGTPVLMHDQTLKRTTRTHGEVAHTPYAHLAQLDAGAAAGKAKADDVVVFQYCGHASHDDYQLNGRLGASRHHPQQLRHLQRDREQRLCGEG